MNSLRPVIFVILIFVATLLAAQGITFPFSRLSLLFAGDLMQHQSQLDAAKVSDGTYSFSSYYRYVKEYIEGADIAIANLETTIGTGRFGGYPAFCAPDSFLYAAADAGFDVLLFANNHCIDRGKKGALYTMQMMDSLGIMHCGVYRDSLDRAIRYPLMIERKGIRMAILNYTYGTNGIQVPEPLIINYIDKKIIASDILKAKRMGADAIIACMHWGDEYISLPPKRVRELSDWLLKQGVDHIIGGHPHVLQPIEVRDGEFNASRSTVAYSLGNFVSGMYARGRDGGVMLRLNMCMVGYITYLQSLEYMLTWVARPYRDGVDNFTILPAVNVPLELPESSRNKCMEFVNDSHSLFELHNKGDINEFY